jgi:hypothetical protein
MIHGRYSAGLYSRVQMNLYSLLVYSMLTSLFTNYNHFEDKLPCAHYMYVNSMHTTCMGWHCEDNHTFTHTCTVVTTIEMLNKFLDEELRPFAWLIGWNDEI